MAARALLRNLPSLGHAPESGGGIVGVHAAAGGVAPMAPRAAQFRTTVHVFAHPLRWGRQLPGEVLMTVGAGVSRLGRLDR